MTLAQLIARLGLEEVARRIGVTPKTLRGWLRKGPSRSGFEALARVAARHLRSVKASRTRKRHTSFRESIAMPARPFEVINDERTGTLGPEQIKPVERPLSDVVGVYSEGVTELDTDRYRGEVHTFTVGQPATEVDAEGLANTAVRVWQDSGRTFARTIFLFFRFIPFNPLYKGEMIRKQGKWFDWWDSTKPWGTINSIHQSVLNVMEDAQRAAESRIIWVEQMQVHVFDDKEDLPDIAAMMERQLR